MQSCKVANHEMYTVYENGDVHSGKLDLLLKPRVNPNGYLVVTLDQEQLSIHRLVALHFLPNPYQYAQVNHIDGDKSNNCVTNLEWCSAERNINHALETGLRKGFVHVDVKRQLLDRVLAGETVADLAVEAGNHANTLNRMLRVQAQKDNKHAEWEAEAKRKRKLVAIRNLEKINARNTSV